MKLIQIRETPLEGQFGHIQHRQEPHSRIKNRIIVLQTSYANAENAIFVLLITGSYYFCPKYRFLSGYASSLSVLLAAAILSFFEASHIKLPFFKNHISSCDMSCIQ